MNDNSRLVDRFLEDTFFPAMRHEMNTQDNQATAHPMYTVQEVRGEGNMDDVCYTLQVFFTRKAAEEFIENEKYNYRKLIIYIKSGNNNLEWIAARRLLKGNGDDT